MILACPDCATRYFVGDDAVPPGGRTVRCAACAAEWKAYPEAPEPLTLAPPPAEPDAAKPPPLPTAFRAKVKAQKQTQSALAAGAVWGGLAASLAAVIGMAVLFRADVVRVWPRTAGAYAALKLPVNPVGLAPEAVQGGATLQDGRAVTVVGGLLRNVTAHPRASVPLRVALFDKAGKRLASEVVVPAGGAIAPGDARAFRAAFVDAPPEAASFGVDFAFDVKPARTPAAPRPRPVRTIAVSPAAALRPLRTPASAPVLRAAAVLSPPAPVEARPLPADSPYALPPAAHG